MNLDLAKQFNMSEKDYHEVLRRLHREPTIVELGLFSAMWSEHCSYRSSKKYLSQLPTKGETVVQGPGENAGIIKITEDLYLTFKVESHNHPSAVEPFQGAATGVGGIIRDIFTMGARPIASLDSLSFDYPTSPRARYLLNGVVEGIAYYGNCVGVPTVGGETHFDACYAENPLINAMSVGILKKSNLRKSEAKTVGAKVIYIGAKTGRDGLHGASFASGNLDAEAQKKRGSVQVGDPFLEKLLIEATLQIIEADLLEAIQDMGAAGLTSSSVEMAGKGGKGIVIHLDKVPLRENDITPLEIMLSESQERMLLIAKEGKEKEIEKILTHWELDYAIIGSITDTGFIEIFTGDKSVCHMPIHNLLNPPETYTEPLRNKTVKVAVPDLYDKNEKDLQTILLDILSKPDFASKQWVYEQYDQTLFSNTVIPPGSGAALLRIKDTNQFLGLTLNSYGLLSAIDPYHGAKTIVSIAARRISALGLKPSAITNCLNFGDPNQPHTMWEFSKTIEGMRDSLDALGIPVVSGNVSFYNEGITKRIYPTPSIGMVGLGALAVAPNNHFQEHGLTVAVLGSTKKESIQADSIPEIDMNREKKVQSVLRLLLKNRYLKSAYSIDRGGIFLALVKNMTPKQIGIKINPSMIHIDPVDFLLSESNSRYLISFEESVIEEIRFCLDGVPLVPIGCTQEACFEWENLCCIPLSQITHLTERSFERYFDDAV